jgi:hypothetical protein
VYKEKNNRPQMDVLCFVGDQSVVDNWDTYERMRDGECWTLEYIHQRCGDLMIRPY